MTWEPAYYTVTVDFKPESVPPYNASDTKTVSFTVQQDAFDVPRQKLFSLAESEIVDQGILDADIMRKYWEPYTIDIEAPSPPPEMAEFTGY